MKYLSEIVFTLLIKLCLVLFCQASDSLKIKSRAFWENDRIVFAEGFDTFGRKIVEYKFHNSKINFWYFEPSIRRSHAATYKYQGTNTKWSEKIMYHFESSPDTDSIMFYGEGFKIKAFYDSLGNLIKATANALIFDLPNLIKPIDLEDLHKIKYQNDTISLSKPIGIVYKYDSLGRISNESMFGFRPIINSEVTYQHDTLSMYSDIDEVNPTIPEIEYQTFNYKHYDILYNWTNNWGSRLIEIKYKIPINITTRYYHKKRKNKFTSNNGVNIFLNDDKQVVKKESYYYIGKRKNVRWVESRYYDESSKKLRKIIKTSPHGVATIQVKYSYWDFD